MLQDRKTVLSRAALALIILISGLAFLPFTGISASQLGWKLYASIYQPELNVEPDKGAPGSAFLFTGSGFQANTLATIYIDGVPAGTVMTSSDGDLVFLIQTTPDDAPDRYFITASTGSNTSATDDFDLETDEPVEPPPAGYDGPVFLLSSQFEFDLYLPIIIME